VAVRSEAVLRKKTLNANYDILYKTRLPISGARQQGQYTSSPWPYLEDSHFIIQPLWYVLWHTLHCSTGSLGSMPSKQTLQSLKTNSYAVYGSETENELIPIWANPWKDGRTQFNFRCQIIGWRSNKNMSSTRKLEVSSLRCFEV
jgi:hypothetical protein